MLIRFRVGGEGLGHEADFDIGANAVISIGVEDLIDDRPIVNRIAVFVFTIHIGGAPFQGGSTVAGAHQIVRAKVDFLLAHFAKLSQQLPAVFHRGVVRFVRAPKTPNRLEFSLLRRGVDLDMNGESLIRRRLAGSRRRVAQEYDSGRRQYSAERRQGNRPPVEANWSSREGSSVGGSVA